MAELRLRIVGECVIEVGERELTPDAPHLFALALYLGVERGRPISRSELCELLFPDAKDTKHAAHCLRQLIYRLRKAGAPIEVQSSAVKMAAGQDQRLLGRLARLDASTRAKTREHDWLVLPSYVPEISDAFVDWLALVCDRVAGELRRLLQADLTVLQRNCEWDALLRLGRIAQHFDQANAEVVKFIVEALVMRGCPSDALREIDLFLAANAGVTYADLQKLRARIARSPHQGRCRPASLHGRKEAIAYLNAHWQSARGGHPSLCLIQGSAGIGKTRLANEFCALASIQGARVLNYRCGASDAQRPLSAFIELTPQLRRLRGSLGASPTHQPYLSLLTGESDVQPTSDQVTFDSTRYNISAALVDLIEAVSSEQPLLINIDDADFLDASSWSVFATLCRSTRAASVAILCSCRASSSDTLAMAGQARASALLLKPLSREQSLALFEELLPDCANDPGRTGWCLDKAGGNPFFLHALARHWSEYRQASDVPFDVRALADAAYRNLDPASRTVLEACLYLGPFATLRRLRDVSGLDDLALLDSSRSLETIGLLSSVTGGFRVTHGLFEDAIRALIPSTVEAVIRERVARCLQADYDRDGFSLYVAWAAAEHWIAVGDNIPAAKILRRCAAHAASVGEPVAAAKTLYRIPRDSLPTGEHRQLLDDVIEYAELGRDMDVLRAALLDRIALGVATVEHSNHLYDFRERLITCQLYLGGDIRPSLPELTAILAAKGAAPEVRARAAFRLLTSADLQLDKKLAKETIDRAADLAPLLPPNHLALMRFKLAYATAFGSQDEAIELSQSLLAVYARPELNQTSITARRDATFALTRLGLAEHARQTIESTYAFMLEHGVLYEALYCICLLADAALSAGETDECAHWLETAKRLFTDGARPPGAYYPIAAALGLLNHAPETVYALVTQAESEYRTMRMPRLKAYMLSLKLLADFAIRGETCDDLAVTHLKCLFHAGRDLGSQDLVAAALWRAEWLATGPESAAKFLGDYLFTHRREKNRVELILREVAARDPSLSKYEMRRRRTDTDWVETF